MFSTNSIVEYTDQMQNLNKNLDDFIKFMITQKEELVKNKVDKGQVYFSEGSKGQILEYFNMLRYLNPSNFDVNGSIDELILKRSFVEMKNTSDYVKNYCDEIEQKFQA